jgi:hypothetical protein
VVGRLEGYCSAVQSACGQRGAGMSSTSPLNAAMAVQLLKHHHFAPQAAVGCSGSEHAPSSRERVFMGTCETHCSATLRSKNNYVDLNGLA